MRYQFIQQQMTGQQVRQPVLSIPPSLSAWCRVMGVSRSGYQAWKKRRAGKRAQEQAELLEKIRVVHQASRQTYGSPRVCHELREQGHRCGVNRIARLMRQHQISAQIKRRFVTTTDSKHEMPVAENLLKQDFTAKEPDQRWVCDFTYLWTGQGWMYLAVVLDLYSRRIVGWAMRNSMDKELVIAALRSAVLLRRPSVGLVCHSDRGSQYASQHYQQQLKESGIVCSMSRVGNCYDNAPAESLFSSFKRELIHRCVFNTYAEARVKIFEWIEVWYNRERRHSTLGYLSPVAFERKNLKAQAEATPPREKGVKPKEPEGCSLPVSECPLQAGIAA